MSNLLSQASLVMIPSGYKEDVVYSPIPTDGSGDLSFTRASNGTRINSAGLVEDVPWNFVQNSENFDAVWTKYNGATVTTNAIVAPNGTTTADLLIAGASQEVYSANMPKVAEELYYTFSCYAKLYNTNVFKMTASDFSTSGVDASFNLSTLSATYVTGATWSNSSASIESVGNGWYKCILTSKSPATTGLYLSLYTSGTNSVSGVYIWGAQVNIGSTAKPYFPTTDRLNVPRLTYQNGGGGCPSLLLEKQSTNLVTYSEQFDNAAWTKNYTTVTANTTTSPDGTQNADSMTENTAYDHHLIYQGSTVSAGAYTQSVFIKKNTRQYAFLQIATDTAVNRYTIVVDLDNGSVTATSTAGSPTGTSNKIDSMGNGWYRVTVTATHTSGEVYSVFGLSDSANPTFSGVATPIYTGNGTGSIYIYGAQIEASSYPTSYIPTTSASATRVADACYRNSYAGGITSEGTIFADFEYLRTDGGYATPCLIINGSNYIYMFVISNTIRANCTNGGVIQSQIISSTVTPNTRYKVAARFKTNDFSLYVNGALIGTDTSGTMPTFSTSFNTYVGTDSSLTEPVGKLNELVIFPVGLTNSELASLTTI